MNLSNRSRLAGLIGKKGVLVKSLLITCCAHFTGVVNRRMYAYAASLTVSRLSREHATIIKEVDKQPKLLLINVSLMVLYDLRNSC